MAATAPAAAQRHHARPWVPLAALILGNTVLALGTWAVRMADSGPVSAGFWRLALAVPVLALLARSSGQSASSLSRRTWLAIAGAGVFFAADLASWHIGIGLTRLGNATLFGNSGSVILMVWGLLALHRRPRLSEVLALAAALAGAAIMLGRSLEIDTRTLAGDLFCLLAGFFYAFYIMLLKNADSRVGNWLLLAGSSAAGLPILLGIALWLGEPVLPGTHGGTWWPLLALGSQIIGQGLLVYSLRHFSSLVIGLGLLTQPAVGVLAGWFVFGEAMTGWDGLGMLLVAAALVLVRAGLGGSGTDKPGPGEQDAVKPG